VQGAATASASKCRERLAIAARMHRTSQRSSIDMATTPTPLHAMESQVRALGAGPRFTSFRSRGVVALFALRREGGTAPQARGEVLPSAHSLDRGNLLASKRTRAWHSRLTTKLKKRLWGVSQEKIVYTGSRASGSLTCQSSLSDSLTTLPPRTAGSGGAAGAQSHVHRHAQATGRHARRRDGFAAGASTWHERAAIRMPLSLPKQIHCGEPRRFGLKLKRTWVPQVTPKRMRVAEELFSKMNI
jgi:hypothetical protein